MAKISIKYSCGCGFSTENILEAVVHSDTCKHSLDVNGRITKDPEEKAVYQETDKEEN